MRRAPARRFVGRSTGWTWTTSTCGRSTPSPIRSSGTRLSAWAESLVPLDRIGEGVDLPQVDVVHVQPVERPTNLLAGALLIASVALGGEKETARLALQPGRDPQLRFAIARCGVDVVDAVAEEDLEGLIRDLLRDPTQRRRTENDPRALVPGAPEQSLWDHFPNLHGSRPSGAGLARQGIVGRRQFNSRGGCQWNFSTSRRKGKSKSRTTS